MNSYKTAGDASENLTHWPTGVCCASKNKHLGEETASLAFQDDDDDGEDDDNEEQELK